jgi:Cholesterol oxidase, substrate-binding
MFTTTDRGLDGKGLIGDDQVYPVSRDIWGPSKDVLLYIKDTTLRVTANGYAVQLRKADLQQAVHDFTAEYTALVTQAQNDKRYPVNAPLEIRVTALDDPSKVDTAPGQTATTPPLSSLTYDDVARQNGWDVALRLDVLTIPGTQYSNDFYTALEEWLIQRFTGSAGRVLPEWSKARAYTSAGPWTSQMFFQHMRDAYTVGRSADQTWSSQVAAFKQYDRSNLFGNPFLDSLFVAS